MPKKRTWTDKQLVEAVAKTTSRRQVLIELGLAAKGGNYAIVKAHIKRLGLDTSHFMGMGWNKGGKCYWARSLPIEELLVADSTFQSHKLKNRLFQLGVKKAACELCGWAGISPDGRIPVELDHINGDHMDNRLENLRILCPNCHSLQPTHRGRNKMRYARVL